MLQAEPSATDPGSHSTIQGDCLLAGRSAGLGMKFIHRHHQTSNPGREPVMKRLIIASAVLFGVCSIGCIGCAEKESAKKETTITMPGGTTTIKTETDIKKTGKTPPDTP
jgi:hypothetical protein